MYGRGRQGCYEDPVNKARNKYQRSWQPASLLMSPSAPPWGASCSLSHCPPHRSLVYKSLEVPNLEDHSEEREGEPHVDVLPLMEPQLGQPLVKPQEGEGIQDILIEGVIIAVDVMGDLVVVPPHKGGAPDEVISHP